MHLVQTCSRLGAPLTSVRTRWMFGVHRRFDRRWEWLTFIPKPGFLPQTSHTAAMAMAMVTDRGALRRSVGLALDTVAG